MLGLVIVRLLNTGTRAPVTSQRGKNRPLLSELWLEEQESHQGPDSGCPRDQTVAHSQPHAQPHEGGVCFCFRRSVSRTR